jgi:signal peptidase
MALTKGGRVFGFVFLCLAGLTVLSYRPVAGYRVQVIVSGSMEPAIKTGSLLLTRNPRPGSYVPGDIISFYPPSRERVLVTHRLLKVYQNASGVRVGETKGDANPVKDPWVISMGSVTGKGVVAVPYVGYLLRLLNTPLAFLVTTLVAFVYFVLPELTFLGSMVRRTHLTDN